MSYEGETIKLDQSTEVIERFSLLDLFSITLGALFGLILSLLTLFTLIGIPVLIILAFRWW